MVKKHIMGTNGQGLYSLMQAARPDLEAHFQAQVELSLRVKVKEGLGKVETRNAGLS